MEKKSKVVKDPLLNAINKSRPTFYFDNEKDYSEFIKLIFGEIPKPNQRYAYRGMCIIYWDKNVNDLIQNDCFFKQMR